MALSGSIPSDPKSTKMPATVRSLPQVVDDLHDHYPDNVWMTVPLDSELSGSWRDVTYKELAVAVHGMLVWMKEAMGDYRRSSGVTAYIGVNDMRYAAVQTALIKAGNKVLLPSPRNSQSGQVSLFQTTGCGLLFHSEGFETHIESIKAALPEVQTLQIPSFDQLCEIGSTSVRLELPSLNVHDDDKVVILHTSGSTGNPKPIYHTNASINTVAATKALPAPQGRQNSMDFFFKADRSMIAVAPFFHMMGQAILWRSLLCRNSIVILPPEKPPTSELIIKAIEQTHPWSGIFPPSVLEQIAEAPGGMDAIKVMKYVFFGGGPLATGIGDKVVHHTTLLSLIGSTEAGLFPMRVPEDKEDWQYFEWAPGAGVTMEADMDGLYEMVIMPADKRYQAVFHTFPGIQEWRTKDLFQRHPRKDLWLYKGRKDDVLVLSNGEKFNPVGFEKLLESHPLVKSALVVGQARFQTGLLVDPEWSLIPKGQDPAELVDTVWPLIEKANATSPAHGRVWRSKTVVSKKNKPFRRTPKGSVVRRQTTELYKAEIDALYSNETGDDELGSLAADADTATIKSFLRQAFKSKGLEIPEASLDDDDIFSYGVDSLQVLALSSTLNHAIGKERGFTISPRDIYGHPTINGLTELLKKGSSNGNTQNQLSREDAMAKMVEKYTREFSSRRVPSPSGRPGKHTYILTGSTGSLGNYILEDLLNSSDVFHVYCLNRSADAESRQRQSFDERGSRADLSNATFLQANFGKDQFGLPDQTYDELLANVDIFIHNAWAVDFNKTLKTYEDIHIAGTRRCADFSLESQFKAHIVFISSIASVGNYLSIDPSVTKVPERIFEDHRAPIPQGYGESKHVASLILATASDVPGVPTTIVRAGQLAGPTGAGAAWNRHEWLPSIVSSSKALRMLPDTLGEGNTVDWVPMDLAARSVVDISRSRTHKSGDLSETCAVTHLVNPKTTTWSDLVPAVQQALELEAGREIEVVPFRVWLDKLAATPRTKEEIDSKPGIKLIDFYEGLIAEAGGLPRLATGKTIKLSNTIANMARIDSELMVKWVGQWRE